MSKMGNYLGSALSEHYQQWWKWPYHIQQTTERTSDGDRAWKGHQARTEPVSSNHWKRDNSPPGISNTSDSWRDVSLRDPTEIFPFSTQAEILGDWILSWFFEWGENNLRTIVCLCAKVHDLLIGLWRSCKEIFSLALKGNVTPPDKSSMVLQWHLLYAALNSQLKRPWYSEISAFIENWWT